MTLCNHQIADQVTLPAKPRFIISTPTRFPQSHSYAHRLNATATNPRGQSQSHSHTATTPPQPPSASTPITMTSPGIAPKRLSQSVVLRPQRISAITPRTRSPIRVLLTIQTATSPTYTWDRANRLLSMGGSSYEYDSLNNRIQQTVGAAVTDYLLDLQPGLAVVLAETTGANTDRYLHTLRGIHAQEDNARNWTWSLPDGLNSNRAEVDNAASAALVQRSRVRVGRHAETISGP